MLSGASDLESGQAGGYAARRPGGRLLRAAAGAVIGGMAGELTEFLVLLFDGRKMDDYTPIPVWMIPAAIMALGSFCYDSPINIHSCLSKLSMYASKVSSAFHGPATAHDDVAAPLLKA